MLARMLDPENNGHLRVEAFDLPTFEIGRRVEDQAINAGFERNCLSHQIADTPVNVRVSFAHQLPPAGRFNFERDGNAFRGFSSSGVQNMCSDRTHFSLLNQLCCLLIQVFGFLTQCLNPFSAFRPLLGDHVIPLAGQ